MFPEQRLMARPFAALEHGHETLAFEWRYRVSVAGLRIFCVRDIDTGCHDIYHVRRRVVERVPFADYLGPTRNKRRRNSAFMHPVFEETERRVAGIGPGPAVAGE